MRATAISGLYTGKLTDEPCESESLAPARFHRNTRRPIKNIGYEVTVCTDISEANGQKFAEQCGCEFVTTYEEVCRHPNVDYVDVCTFPDFRLQPIEICAETKKHVQVQKPISTNLETAREMIETRAQGRHSARRCQPAPL